MYTKSNTTKERLWGVWSAVGYFFLIIAVLMTFAFFMELDPQGKQWKKEGTPVSVIVLSIEPELFVGIEETKTALATKRMDGYRSLEVGDHLYGYSIEEGTIFVPDTALPAAPRDWGDSWFFMSCWIIALLCFTYDPSLLFIDSKVAKRYGI